MYICCVYIGCGGVLSFEQQKKTSPKTSSALSRGPAHLASKTNGKHHYPRGAIYKCRARAWCTRAFSGCVCVCVSAYFSTCKSDGGAPFHKMRRPRAATIHTHTAPTRANLCKICNIRLIEDQLRASATQHTHTHIEIQVAPIAVPPLIVCEPKRETIRARYIFAIPRSARAWGSSKSRVYIIYRVEVE